MANIFKISSQNTLATDKTTHLSNFQMFITMGYVFNLFFVVEKMPSEDNIWTFNTIYWDNTLHFPPFPTAKLIAL